MEFKWVNICKALGLVPGTWWVLCKWVSHKVKMALVHDSTQLWGFHLMVGGVGGGSTRNTPPLGYLPSLPFWGPGREWMGARGAPPHFSLEAFPFFNQFWRCPFSFLIHVPTGLWKFSRRWGLGGRPWPLTHFWEGNFVEWGHMCGDLNQLHGTRMKGGYNSNQEQGKHTMATRGAGGRGSRIHLTIHMSTIQLPIHPSIYPHHHHHHPIHPCAYLSTHLSITTANAGHPFWVRHTVPAFKQLIV